MRATPITVEQGHAVEEGAPGGGIRLRGLSRAFGATLALAPLDLDIGPGGITGLLGPNGSGKSTLLRCLVGLVPATSGSVWIDGAQLVGDGVEIRKRCTFTPGELSLYGSMRAGDQLDWLVAGRGAEARQRARRFAEDFELPLRQRIRTYSHGMKRQLLFSAALGPRVHVRLLDEITEGLDPSKRGVVLEKLREDERAGTTILLSSHHLGEVQRVCHRIIFMQAGRKLSEESAQSVLSRSRRLVRMRFDSSIAKEQLERASRIAGVASTSGNAQRFLLHLEEEDVRPVLRQLFSDPSIPRPLGLEYGELSLEDLYSDIYGEDAC